mgnify:CR=1 FL=1
MERAVSAGTASTLHHDSLFEGGLPRWAALALFLGSWQLMTAAMMLPSSLPRVRLFWAASRRREALAAFLGGYVLVWIAQDHHFAAMRNARGLVAEHRLVMANRPDRALFPHERVHHRDGQRQNNAPENLELWEESHPPGQRISDRKPAPHCPTCRCGDS